MVWQRPFWDRNWGRSTRVRVSIQGRRVVIYEASIEGRAQLLKSESNGLIKIRIPSIA